METSSEETKQTTNYYDYVYKNKVKSDIDIVLKNKVIKAHKQVLGPQNPVFLNRFMTQPRLKKIELLDLDPNAVQIFIDYLYTGKLSARDISEQLFLVAHKHSSSTLKNICQEKFAQNWSIENAVQRLLLFLQCEEEQLIREASVFLVHNFNDVKNQLDFKQVLENEQAVAAIFDAFDYCKITVLLDKKKPDKKKLFESAKKSDLTIKVQDHTFLGHKKILSTRNTVFETVISALPKNNDLSSSIDIPDFDPVTFKIFLKFIYTRNVLKEEISIELMTVAHNYVDTNLKKICEDHLAVSISEETVVELLVLSTKVGSEKLKAKTSEFIAAKYSEMKQRDEFRLVKQNPEAVEAIFSQFEVRIDSLYSSFTVQKETRSFFGTFELKVPTSVGRVDSHQFYMKNVGWNIFARLSANKPTHLAMFLKCNDKNDADHVVEYSFKLVSSTSILWDVSSNESKRRFTSRDNGRKWGYSEFVSLSDLHDPMKGLISNGVMKIEVNARIAK